MHPQSFHWADISVVAALVLLEGLLSGDNAIVLAVIARDLPADQRKKALLYGVVGAFALRFVAILTASLVLRLWWIQAVGAGYLLYITANHFWKSASNKEKTPPVPKGFWPTVFTIEVVDFAFAMDSVLAGVAFVGGKMDKIWLVWFGAVIGILLLRVASGFFINLLEKVPALDHIAYLFVGWVGVKLAMLAAHSAHATGIIPGAVPEMADYVFWTGMGAAVLAGLWVVLREKWAKPMREAGEAED